MKIHPPSARSTSLRRLAVTTLAAGALASAQGIAHAEEDSAEAAKRDPMIDLLEKLKEKGIISEEEVRTLSGDTSEERIRRRAESRKKAQREAEENQKAEAAKCQVPAVCPPA